MTVSRFTLPSNGVDGDLSVLARIAAVFAPHEADPPGMLVVIDEGHIVVGGQLLEVERQAVSNIIPPTSSSRIDRVVADSRTGAASYVIGIESSNPSPPDIPVGNFPIARISLSTGVTSITNGMVTDERDLSPLAQPAGSLISARRFTAGTYIYKATPGTRSVVVEVVGSGGSGGGCQATSGTTAAAGGGGGAGSFARAWLKDNFDGVTITVGAGVPAGAAGAAGGTGNTSSFGTLVSAEGGRGGSLGNAAVPPGLTFGSTVSPLPVGGNLVAAGGQGGGLGLVLGLNAVMGGSGGISTFGANSSGGMNGPGTGTTANSYGGGGGGASGAANSPARPGGASNGGLVIVYEYS